MNNPLSRLDMTDDPNQHNRDLLAEIAQVQAERRRNWKSGQPASVALEEAHVERIAHLKSQLSSARQVAEPDASPPRGGTQQKPGVGAVREGNLFSRLLRRFTARA